MARKQRNRIPGRHEIVGGMAVVALLATVYLVRGGPDITSADEPGRSIWRSPEDGGPEPAPTRRSNPRAADAAEDATDELSRHDWPDAL